MSNPGSFFTAVLCSLSIGPLAMGAVAADDHASHHEADASKSVAAESSSGAMTNMKKMQEQMAAIRVAKNPAERARLMDEHMQAMQATMQTMQQDKGCAMMDNGGMNSGMAMKDMKSGGGMNMMQMMMEQMEQHQKAMQMPAR